MLADWWDISLGIEKGSCTGPIPKDLNLIGMTIAHKPCFDREVLLQSCDIISYQFYPMMLGKVPDSKTFDSGCRLPPFHIYSMAISGT